MCFSALQVDLVGSEKLNNSMGFSMFFVGLGCLTGPPLAGEQTSSCKFTKSYACADPLFPNVHKHIYEFCMCTGWLPWLYISEVIRYTEGHRDVCACFRVS